MAKVTHLHTRHRRPRTTMMQEDPVGCGAAKSVRVMPGWVSARVALLHANRPRGHGRISVSAQPPA